VLLAVFVIAAEAALCAGETTEGSSGNFGGASELSHKVVSHHFVAGIFSRFHA